MPKLKCDFYQVVLPTNETRTFQGLIGEVAAMPADRTRTRQWHEEYLLRLNQVEMVGQLIMVDMLRIEMNDVVDKAHIDGQISPLNLGDEEGPLRHTYFLYDPETKTMVFSKANTGVSTTATRFYFEDTCRVNRIDIDPWFDDDTYAKLSGLRNARSLDMTILTRAAIPTDLSSLRGTTGSIFQAIRASNNLQAPVVSVKFQMRGRERGSIGTRDDVIDEARALRRMNEESPGTVRKLTVSGDIDGLSGSDPLDLLKGKIIERIDMPGRTRRQWTPKDYKDALLEAWQRRCEEITALAGRS